MNKRQAKKKRKQEEQRAEEIMQALEKLPEIVRRIGEALNKWVEAGMPFTKEQEEDEEDERGHQGNN